MTERHGPNRERIEKLRRYAPFYKELETNRAFHIDYEIARIKEWNRVLREHGGTQLRVPTDADAHWQELIIRRAKQLGRIRR